MFLRIKYKLDGHSPVWGLFEVTGASDAEAAAALAAVIPTARMITWEVAFVPTGS